MAYIDLLSSVHKATKRDYLARVNDPEFPKAKAAELAKQWGYDISRRLPDPVFAEFATVVINTFLDAGRLLRKR